MGGFQKPTQLIHCVSVCYQRTLVIWQGVAAQRLHSGQLALIAGRRWNFLMGFLSSVFFLGGGFGREPLLQTPGKLTNWYPKNEAMLLGNRRFTCSIGPWFLVSIRYFFWWGTKYTFSVANILLMEEILYHLGYIILVNSGINHQSTGAVF